MSISPAQESSTSALTSWPSWSFPRQSQNVVPPVCRNENPSTSVDQAYTLLTETFSSSPSVWIPWNSFSWNSNRILWSMWSIRSLSARCSSLTLVPPFWRLRFIDKHWKGSEDLSKRLGKGGGEFQLHLIPRFKRNLMITRCSTSVFMWSWTSFGVPAAGMHFCERVREDPGNLETVHESHRSNDVRIIVPGGTDYRHLARMQAFPIPLNSGKSAHYRGNQGFTWWAIAAGSLVEYINGNYGCATSGKWHESE
jgi:hypothetical protein